MGEHDVVLAGVGWCLSAEATHTTTRDREERDVNGFRYAELEFVIVVAEFVQLGTWFDASEHEFVGVGDRHHTAGGAILSGDAVSSNHVIINVYVNQS